MLALVATLTVSAGSQERAVAAVQEVVTATRAEEGNIEYLAHQDTTDPRIIVFYERWVNEEALEQHMASPHILRMREALDGLVESTEMRILTPL